MSSYALMLSAGAPLVFVSAQLGHKTPATTLKYYARWIPSDGDRWADILEPNLGTNARRRRGVGRRTR